MRMKIVDFNITHSKYEFLNKPLTLIFNTGESTTVTYARVSRVNIDNIKNVKSSFEAVLDILNKIYIEHIKLEMLGSEYPIYTIYNISADCSLNGFSGNGTYIKTYSVKDFVKELRINKEFNFKVKELIVNHKLEIMSLGDDKNIYIRGLENIVFLSNGSVSCIDYTLLKDESKVLRFKYLDGNLPRNKKIRYAEEVILDNTCKIEDIDTRTLRNIINLNKLTLCRSVKTIGGIDLKDCIRKRDDNSYYINLDNLDGRMSLAYIYDKIIEIEFNYEVNF